MAEKYPKIPVINVGRYSGTPIDQLPTSYLRWMLGQDFPAEWLAIAKAKVDASPFHNEPLTVSRHAIDRFSLRFAQLWQHHLAGKPEKPDGIATFLVKLAEDAWKNGSDVSKNRHQDDGIVKFHRGIKFVFNQNEKFPDYKELITVM